jgi:hypothetical protein
MGNDMTEMPLARRGRLDDGVFIAGHLHRLIALLTATLMQQFASLANAGHSQ